MVVFQIGNKLLESCHCLQSNVVIRNLFSLCQYWKVEGDISGLPPYHLHASFFFQAYSDSLQCKTTLAFAVTSLFNYDCRCLSFFLFVHFNFLHAEQPYILICKGVQCGFSFYSKKLLTLFSLSSIEFFT